MKIALLNDTHFGARNDSPAFEKYFFKFYEEQFFPYLEENNIKTFVHLGDVVDRRKFINFKTAHAFRQRFMKRLWEMKIDTHIIIGNHDTYFKNTNKVNSITELCTTYDGINEPWIYTGPKEVELGGCKILFVPWICDENYEESIQAIKNSTAEVCMGHLEIKGFEMQKGMINEQGLDKSIFKRFEKVISGHFHKKSDDGQIYYCGAQYEMTWSDYKDPKGFHVFDTETRELTRIPNPRRIHKKLIYNDKDNDYTNLDLTEFDETFIKVFVTNKTNESMFNNLIDKLHNTINAHEIMIIEDLNTDLTASVKEDILDQGEDTLTFLGNYVEQADTDLDKQKLKEHLKELYVEASER
jgi:DNA repair exonuclease SbcCD nuclease subunit